MTIAEFMILAAACGALTLAAGAAVQRPQRLSQWLFLVGMLMLGAEALCQFAAASAGEMATTQFWLRASIIPASTLPAVWLAFSLSHARGTPMLFLKRWAPALALLALVPISTIIWFTTGLMSGPVWVKQDAHWVFPILPAGWVVHLAFLVGSVATMANLEWTFRAAVGTARWKIKYGIFGLALLCAARICSSSQTLVYSVVSTQLVLLNAAALVVGCLFFLVWIYRSKSAQLDIYPSTDALHKSFSIILAGIYLAIVGFMAKGLTLVVGPNAFPLVAILVLLAVGGLGMLCFSDRFHRAVREFVSRHFRRPIHDYRKVWSRFAHRTAAVVDRQEFTRAMANLLSETFEALSVTIWLADDTERGLRLSASTSIETGAPASVALTAEVYEGIRKDLQAGRPFDIDRSDATWCDSLRECNPSRFTTGGHRLCLPLKFGDEFVGLIVMGDRVGTARFSLEDLELFACLGEQIASSLRSLRLSEKLIQARELEAFQAMSAFLVHDLKNTAASLSLTLRNLPDHFDNPQFREDALRSLTKSVGRVNDLIGRLTMLRRQVELKRVPIDLNGVVESALASVGPMPEVKVVRQFGDLPPVLADVQQIESAVVNLVINAKEAMSSRGEMRIETRSDDGGVTLAVADTGCGMTPHFMSNSLFRPFKTSKKNGLGIGMFQTKTIIEAHGGRITVRSEPDEGTTFSVWLPRSAPAMGGSA